jgi:hypothetical protein
VTAFCTEVASGNILVSSLIKRRIFARDYYALFSWEAKNANTFFSNFGAEFKAHMSKMVSEKPELDQAVRDFLSIGLERNRLVHQDFATFTLEKTTKEIYHQYGSASRFVQCLKEELHTCSEVIAQAASA